MSWNKRKILCFLVVYDLCFDIIYIKIFYLIQTFTSNISTQISVELFFSSFTKNKKKKEIYYSTHCNRHLILFKEQFIKAIYLE